MTATTTLAEPSIQTSVSRELDCGRVATERHTAFLCANDNTGLLDESLFAFPPSGDFRYCTPSLGLYVRHSAAGEE
jgi:hypothetical protein